MTPTHALTTDRTLVSWLTPAVRRWLYTIATALVPLLVVYGILEESTAPLWTALVASILGTGTAMMHTGGVYEAPLVAVPDITDQPGGGANAPTVES